MTPTKADEDLTVNLGLDINEEINVEVKLYASTAAPSDIKTYKWDFNGDDIFDVTVNGGDAKDAAMNYTYSEEGLYEVIVEVVDNEDYTARDNITVNITAPYEADFTIVVTSEFNKAKVGQEVIFTATLKSDGEIPVTKRDFKWDFDYNDYFDADYYSEVYTSLAKKSNIYDKPGSYEIVVEVEGKQGSTTIEITEEDSGGLGGFSFNMVYIIVPVIFIIIVVVIFSLRRRGSLYEHEGIEEPPGEKVTVSKTVTPEDLRRESLRSKDVVTDEKPTTKKCPSCKGLILIPTSKRPLVVSCSVCGKQFTLKKKEDRVEKTIIKEEETPTTKKCPQCGGVINIPSSKRPLKVQCSSCWKEYTLKKKVQEEITDIAVCPKCGKSIPVMGSQKNVKCSCGEVVSVE